jgi:hypothetical protein
MTSAQKATLAAASPATNLLLIDSTLGRIDRYDGSNFHNVGDSPVLIPYSFEAAQSVDTWMRFGETQPASDEGMRMAKAGSIVTHSTFTDVQLATTGDVTFEVRINNVNQASLENEFTSGEGTGKKSKSVTVARDSVTFSAGDLLTAVANETGTMGWAAVIGYIEVVFDT